MIVGLWGIICGLLGYSLRACDCPALMTVRDYERRETAVGYASVSKHCGFASSYISGLHNV